MSDAGLWRYRAALQRVIDADSLSLVVDLGFRAQLVDLHVRLIGINAPEVHGPQREAGLAAKAYAEQWLQLGLQPQTPWGLLVETAKGDAADKYGNRWLARVIRTLDGRCLNDDLVVAGHAVLWDGKGIKPT